MSEEPPRSEGPMSGRPMVRERNWLLVKMAGIGASAQAAIPGLYAWAVTVAPAAWSRNAPSIARGAAMLGVIALVTAPVIEGAAAREGAPPRAWTGPTAARIWSVWGFVLSSAVVWALAPSALSSARLDGWRGALGMVGWALFAFASAGPVLHVDPSAAARSTRTTSLKPRNEIPGGDGWYVAFGVAGALAMQTVGWGVAVPERAVLVRLVTVVCGIAILGGATSIALARHQKRTPARARLRLRRAAPWLVMFAFVGLAGLAVGLLR